MGQGPIPHKHYPKYPPPASPPPPRVKNISLHMELSLENLNFLKYLSDAIYMSEGILGGR